MRITKEMMKLIGKLPMPDRFWAWVDKKGPDECWEWRGFLPNRKWKYGGFSIKKHKFRSHRLAFELHHGRKVRPGLLICHSCDNPPCCNPRHLFEGTQKDNLQDMSRKGRSPSPKTGLGLFGERHMASALTNRNAAKIRSLYKTGKFYQKKLATMFGVCQGTIHNVLHGKHYPDSNYKSPPSFDFLRKAKSYFARKSRLDRIAQSSSAPQLHLPASGATAR